MCVTSPSPPPLPRVYWLLLLIYITTITLETTRTLTPSEIIIIIIIIMKCVIQCYSRADREKRVESAKISITALLKSWPGKRGRERERTLLYIIIILFLGFLLLLNPSTNGVSTIINMLPLTDPFIQVTLIT